MTVRAQRQANEEMSISMKCRDWQNSRIAWSQSPKDRWHCVRLKTTPLQNVSFVSATLVLRKSRKSMLMSSGVIIS